MVAFLLVGTLLWGFCPACPLVPSAPAQTSGEHDCCPSPAGQNSEHAPRPDQSGELCTGQIAGPDPFVASGVQAIDALPVSVPAVEITIEAAVAVPVPADLATTISSPPDLYLHNATLLI